MSASPLTPAIREQFDVRIDHGALVLDVDSGGPAAAAGVRAGDVITEFAGHPIRSVEDLPTGLRQVEPGDQQPVTGSRDGQGQELTVTVGSRTG